MTNEIELHTGHAEIVPTRDEHARSTGYAKLREHALAKAEAWDYAEFITSTGMCPDIFRGKPKDATVAILRGAMLGFDPDSSLEALFVIHGKVGMYARAKYAVALSRGADMYEVEASDTSVTWAGTKPGDDQVQTVTWTIERATKAKYVTNSKYATNPQQMLRAKCQSELADLLAPGALLGLIDEVDQDQQQPVRATAERVDRPKRGTAGVAAALGIDKAEPVTEPAPPETASRAELGGLTKALDAAGIERDERKAFLSARVGRDLAAASELTSAEVAAIVDFIENGESA
ncbi:hypothetical protein DW322_11150 [Rhodococcus rhodnii]|uniref:RecT-like ssDNA binding protein n=2 Tax=Rhodococcus rhodnii TaxID=38312 RepID=R7WRU4_9NOCA|nr:hypothetical protein [Rhodococcus rhodnii]EOM78038.1 hypothetical protein Rrhod_0579 [Rhodococcus rhodnii LMG 5362]TXG90668.1 hypothetical protein DW322_11150 [Rhodococcus rhodnii]